MKLEVETAEGGVLIKVDLSELEVEGADDIVVGLAAISGMVAPRVPTGNLTADGILERSETLGEAGAGWD